MKYVFKIASIAGLLLCLGSGCVPERAADVQPRTPPAGTAPSVSGDAAPQQPSTPPRAAALSPPIEGAIGRATMKTFGLKVSPSHSPISPERFSGYHAGVDFETTPEEQGIDIPIRAACDGTLALKETASGYGGVAVERCTLDGAEVAVIYGHLRPSSVVAKVGKSLKAGDAIGVLGTGYSKETDGERKHLHFGVHKGASITIRGYVQTQTELGAWLDPLPLLQ